jgi:hypothetical protein
LNEQINTYRDKVVVFCPPMALSVVTDENFNASGNSPLITVVTNQSNIDNYGNVGTIRISTTGNNKIFSQVTENTYSNDITNWHLGRLSSVVVPSALVSLACLPSASYSQVVVRPFGPVPTVVFFVFPFTALYLKIFR